MRIVMKHYAVIGLLLASSSVGVAQNSAALTDHGDAATKAAFKAAITSYLTQRRVIEAGMPMLSTEATPAQIADHKATLFERIAASRKGAKKGDILTPSAAAMISKIVKENYSATELGNLKAENTEADTKGVRLRVNAAYPEGREKIEMPPRLLLVLPELPDELNYHFFGRHLIILDKESGLIVDFMTKAL